MAIQVGDRIKLNEKGMSTDSSKKKAWLNNLPVLVDQVKRRKYLTVTSITAQGNFFVVENDSIWPRQMFEKVQSLDVFLTVQDREVLLNLLQSQMGIDASQRDIYTRLIDKLKLK